MIDQEFQEAVGSRFREILTEGLQEFGQLLLQDIQGRISIPVEYVTGPRGGIDVIRSNPGESPRYEFGTLWNSITLEPVKQESPTAISVEITTYYRVAAYLENGTEDGRLAKRPFWPDQEELDSRSGEFTDVLASHF
jgi:hypothetical protein